MRKNVIALIVLIGFLFILLFFEYETNGRSYASASFFMTVAFTISAVASLLLVDTLNLDIHTITIGIIAAGIFSFFLGEKVGLLTRAKAEQKLKRTPVPELDSPQPIVIKPWATFLVMAFMLVVLYFYFRVMYRASVLAGNKYGIAGMFAYARIALNSASYDSETGGLLAHLTLMTECIGYIYLYVNVYNICIKAKNSVLNYIPCVLYMGQIGLSTARVGFITYLIAGIVMSMIIREKLNPEACRISRKALIRVLLVAFVLLAGFRLLGYLTGKSVLRELWMDIAAYVGSSIPAFDQYLQSKPLTNEFFGKETLYNVYRLLDKLGIYTLRADDYSAILPFTVIITGFKVNVYTAFRRLIQDFGIVWAFAIMFFEGIFYGTWLTKQKVNKWTGLSTIIFAYMFYPVVLSFVEEKFILNFTETRLIYKLVYFFILYWLLIRNRQYYPEKKKE